MTKNLFYFILFLFLLGCSLNQNSKFWTKEKKILVDKDKKNIENYLVCILIKEPGDLKKSKIEINNDLKNILKSYFKKFWS